MFIKKGGSNTEKYQVQILKSYFIGNGGGIKQSHGQRGVTGICEVRARA